MLYVFFLITFSHAEDLDRDALSAMAGATAQLASVNPTVSSSGKNPRCPPQVNALTPTLRSLCPNAEKYPAKGYPTQMIKGAAGQNLAVSVINEEDAPKIFAQVKALNLPWGSARLCVQRGLIMGFCLEHAMKLQVAKVIALPGTLGGPIAPQCGSSRGAYWPQHQAVTLLVKSKDGSTKPYVLDPSTMDKMVPNEEWEQCLKNTGHFYVGSASAMNWQEASMSTPPEFNADATHDIERNWRLDSHR